MPVRTCVWLWARSSYEARAAFAFLDFSRRWRSALSLYLGVSLAGGGAAGTGVAYWDQIRLINYTLALKHWNCP